MIKNKGITLIEVLISIAILVIILVLALPPLSGFKKTQGLRNTTDDMVSLLNEARSKTLAGEAGEVFNVFFEDDKATIYKGSSLNPSDSYTREVFFDSSVTLPSINISLYGTAHTVSFDKLSGDTINYGTILLELVSDPSTTKTITVSQTGIISSN